MNNLYETTIKGFLLQGYEIYKQCSWLTTMRKFKSVHVTEDLKVIESVISVIIPDEEYPNDIYIRNAYYEE